MKLELGETEEVADELDEPERAPRNCIASIRRWYRGHNIGAMLWFVVGAYVLWRMYHVVRGLHPRLRDELEESVWPNTRQIFVLYVFPRETLLIGIVVIHCRRPDTIPSENIQAFQILSGIHHILA